MPTSSLFPGQNDTLANLPDRKDNRDYNLADDINEYRHYMIATEPMLGDQIQGGGANDFWLAQNGLTPPLTVLITPGTVWFGQTEIIKRPGPFVGPTHTAPTTHDRIDVVSIDSGGTFNITQGTENVTPAAPACPIGQWKCGEVYLRPGCTQIYSYANQIGGQGYIRPDTRAKNSLPYVAPGSITDDLLAASLLARINSLVNPGLESWGSGNGPFTANNAVTADAWTIVLAGTDTLSVSRDGTNKKADSVYAAAGVFVLGTGAGGTQLKQRLTIAQGYAHLLGKAISLRAAVKLAAGVASAVRAFIKTDGTAGTTTYSAYHGNNTNFEDLTVLNLTVPADATYIEVGIALAASCTAYLDDCVLNQGVSVENFTTIRQIDQSLPALALAKGDMAVASAAQQTGRVPVGADGSVLTADSTQTAGVAWKAASGGGGADPAPALLSANGTATGTTASGALASALTSTGTGNRQLYAVRIHFSGATSGNITVTLSSAAGAAYNALLNPSASQALNADTDFVWVPDIPVYLGTGDQIVINGSGLTNGLTYGVEADMSAVLGGNLVIVTNTGSAGEINFTSTLTGAFKFACVSVHFNAGITGTFKINRAANAGSAYNDLLATANLTADTDISQNLDAASVMNSGDQVHFVSTGVTGNTWGLRACFLQ